MDTRYKSDFITAGKMAAEVRAYGKSLISCGASYNEVIRKIREKIQSLGALPAFPPQIALDNVAAHYLPDPCEDIIFKDQLIKLDIGVCYNGAIGDCAVTIDLSGRHQKLIDAAEAALKAAIETVRLGVSVGEIGEVIEKTIVSFDLNPVRNLSGHGLGKYKVHTSPHIPNYKDNSKNRITSNMTFAIEPFATDGKGHVIGAGKAHLFAARPTKKTYTGFIADVYKTAQSFGGLPFCTNDLMTDTLPYELLKKAIALLVKEGALDDFAPLKEQSGGLVAQAEDSILIDEKGRVFVTTR